LFSATADSAEASAALLAASAEVRDFAEPGFQSTEATEEFRYFAILLEACARLVAWKAAVRDCEADTERYLRGAKFLLNEAAAKGPQVPISMTKPAQMIAGLSDVSKIGEVFRDVLAVPLPITFPLESPRAFRDRVAREPREEVPPVGSAPLKFRASKRMLIKQAASFLARPMAFTYRATFSRTDDITTEGQRHLSVRCFDPKSDPQSGYEQVDQKLVAIRDQARRYPLGLLKTKVGRL